MKAAITVEAACLFSILLLILGWTMRLTLEYYVQTREKLEDCVTEQTEPAAYFRKIDWIGRLAGQDGE